jgi:predicted CXXCH cytochrome family protein
VLFKEFGMKIATFSSRRGTWMVLVLFWTAAAAVAVHMYGGAFSGQPSGASPANPSTVLASTRLATPAPLTAHPELPFLSAAAEELDNKSCIECHNPDMLKRAPDELAEMVEVEGEPKPPRPKQPYTFGTLSLSIDEKAYGEGIHKEITCVNCHKDVTSSPHKQRLAKVDCMECHDDAVSSIKASAHGEKAGPKAPDCVGCHDVHQGKEIKAYAKDFQRKVCVDCHNAYGLNTDKGHQKLYEYRLHLKMECMACHQGAKPGVHQIPKVATKVARCESCHNYSTVLSKEKKPAVDFATYIRQTSFTNADALKKYGYALGANRIPLLDLLIVLAVIAPLGLPVVHGGLRILTRRKEPIHLPEEKILLHPAIERLWHWFQALCIVMLIITGVILHWPERFPGSFEWAVKWHNWFGIAVVIAWLVWFFYNLATGRISHYIPKKSDIPKGMLVQARFYGYGIFKHEPHPYAPSEDNKFNPLQKIAYLKFQLLLFPILLISGIMYMFPETFQGVIAAIGGMGVLGVIHYILGGLFAAFLVAHMYLATTGETIGENFKAIITGYGIKSDHGDHHA